MGGIFISSLCFKVVAMTSFGCLGLAESVSVFYF